MATSTQTTLPFAKPPSPPWIPPELISLILTKLWDAPQTPQERLALLKNVALVNRTWLPLAACIASYDVHIPSPLSAKGFLRLLPKHQLTQESHDLFTVEANRVADQMCHSITFHASRSVPPSQLELSEDPAAVPLWLGPQNDDALMAVSAVLHRVTAYDRLPNLRHISLQYTDRSFDDVFEQLDSQTFPPQVTHLSINYSFTISARTTFAVHLRSIFRRERFIHGTLPNVRHLSLSGVTTGFMLDLLTVCPNADTLEITHPVGLVMLGSLPPSTRTLVLRLPGIAWSKHTMDSWVLVPALQCGLFRRVSKPQIVVRSGTPDPVALMELRQTCKRFGAQVLYERDDSSRRSF